ncbi:MAG TPA: mannose-1-phosphate guanylyltransferase [Clostridiaceae bacterium]
MIAVVIMAGGKGERFWPKSRIKLPKQLLCLTDDGKSMIQLTVERLKTLVAVANIYIATGQEYASIISEQLPQVPTENIIVEPMGKNTAACIGLAAIHVHKKDPEAVMIVLPSDHLIKEEEKFIKSLNFAVDVAERGENIVTIGINPTYAETGYGYINFKDEIEEHNGIKLLKVEKFVEKPNLVTAEEYLATGKYLWNSGMFIWKVSTILSDIKKFMPNLYKALEEIKKHLDGADVEELLYKVYSTLESISVDYGILEKSDSIMMIAGDFGWDDLGVWSSLDRIRKTDVNGNVIEGNVINLDTMNCIIEGSNKLIATIGLEEIVIVDTEDAILICKKDRCQDIKTLLNQIKPLNNGDYL